MEGLYFNVINELTHIIRFYDDGSVFGTSMSSDYANSSDILNWFKREKYDASWGKGNYNLKSDSLSKFTNDYIRISFTLSSNNGNLIYSGFIINSEKLNLTFDKEYDNANNQEFQWPSRKDFQTLTFQRFHSEEETNLKRYQGYLGLMIEFKPSELFEEFSGQYVIENGKDKFEKIADIVKTSDEVKTYLNNLKWQSSKPNSEELQLLMISHPYFSWSKEETICLGALGVIIIWANNSQETESERIVNKIMANLIDHCSKQKYNPFDNFFFRYYRRLKLIWDSRNQ